MQCVCLSGVMCVSVVCNICVSWQGRVSDVQIHIYIYIVCLSVSVSLSLSLCLSVSLSNTNARSLTHSLTHSLKRLHAHR